MEPERIAPNRCVLPVVDVQNDYCHDDDRWTDWAAVERAWAEAATP